jgi:hypothetical protein
MTYAPCQTTSPQHLLRWLLVLPLIAAAGLPLCTASAQDQADPKGRELVHSATFMKKKLEELLVQMSEIATLMEENDPEVARILRQTVEHAQRELVTEKMDQVIRNLRKGLDQAAASTHNQVIGDLTRMLRILEGGVQDISDTEKELARLNAIREQLADVRSRQEREERLSRAAAHRKELDEQGQALLAEVAELIAAQKKLQQKTNALPELAAQARRLAELIRALAELRSDQQALANQVGNAAVGNLPVFGQAQAKLQVRATKLIAQVKAANDNTLRGALQTAGGDPAAPGQAASKVTSAAAEMQRSREALARSDARDAATPQAQATVDLHDAEALLAQTLKALLARTDHAPTAEKQNDLAAKTRQLGESMEKLADLAGVDPATLDEQSGQTPSHQAAKTAAKMTDAAKDIATGQKTPAGKNQADALAQLDRLRDQARKLQDEALARANKPLDPAEQKQIAENLDEMAQRMKESGQQPTPGQPDVAQASKSASQAAGDMGENNPTDANTQQNKTLENLDEAMEQMDEKIAQLERRSKAEKLAKIEQRLELVLEEQKTATARTKRTWEARKPGSDPYDRQAVQTLNELAKTERGLAEEIKAIVMLLSKEGSTVVFPRILDQVRSDLVEVSRSLADRQAGPLTQATQQQIEATLEEMIASVREELSRGLKKKGGMGGGGGGGKKPPLVPPVAELRMLRLQQLHVNRLTQQLDTMARNNAIPTEKMSTEQARLRERQKAVLDLTREMAEKLKKEKSDGGF